MIGPNQKLRDPEFGGKLNSFHHHYQAFDLLLLEVKDPQNLYSSYYLPYNSIGYQLNEDL